MIPISRRLENYIKTTLKGKYIFPNIDVMHVFLEDFRGGDFL